MATVLFLPAFLMNSVKSACFKSAAMPRYRGSSGIASATADLLASPIGDENRQRPLPRMPDTRVPSTRLPLPRIQETPLITADLLVVLPVLLSLTSTPASLLFFV